MTDLLEFSNTFVTKYIMDSYYDNPDGFHKINGFVRYPLGLTVGQRQADISNILMLIKRSLSDTQKEDITDTWQDFDLAMEYVRQEYISKEYTKQINEIIRTLNDAHENIRIETNEQILSENEDYNKSKNDMLMSSLLSEFKHGNEQTERMREEYFLNKQRGGGFDYR